MLSNLSFLFLKVLPIGALSTSIGSAASSECVLVVSGGLAEGLGCGLSVLRQATSIFGICTQYVRCASIDGRWVLSIDGGLSLSIDGMTSVPIDIDINMVSSIDTLESQSINFDSRPSIDVRSLASIDTNAIRRNSSSFPLRNLLLAASPALPLARNNHL
ncbi:hypothetical protein F2Q70_00003649 [Brassica cretica]|uniref:Secreted protein n=1 Tax=Brassica cretica TaxID=69181 RepID=A0A8S9J0F1_BRACR|nr:hypothetical protein F2Q70_00003649 [Brassica cretica]